MTDWKDTLNLPRTAFPMKANLPSAEPATLSRWATMNLYEQIRVRRKGAPKFILHDGPPYTTGSIHTGTAMNKILKDFVVKSKSMGGYDAPFVVGYDCHGLPIELQLDRELGPKKRELSTADFRRACRAYATRFIDVMTQQFQRLGIFGTWDDPYLTMDFRYQAAIARAFGRFVERGLVYKGKKPVHWCIHCRTALAEAEVEYEDHSSPSIYVEFPLTPASASDLAARVPVPGGSNISVLIWTTTPWTIPSNLAIAFHPEYLYGAYDSDGRGKLVIVAEQLADAVAREMGRPLGTPVARFTGEQLEGLRFKHPLYDRDSLAVLADYVTLEQGTGAVHTAPGHGSDDFSTGVRYGLDIYAPVGPDGRFLEQVGLFAGLQVFDANAKVEAALGEAGRLWHRAEIVHAYPHCWRCHNPVIFLATSQWFIRMDGEPVIGNQTLRASALHAVDHQVRWVPGWGRDRIYNMLANRPDWCISRQRAWGVPIPALDCTTCGEALLTPGLVERAASVFSRYGADAWYERPMEEFLPPGLSCPACGGTAFEREKDILDVWFDSGSSHEAVLSVRPELTWPADLYLEGSDQHRGWFQSSLLVGLGTRGRAPFHEVVTHGFIVADDGRKMSKSLGNSIEPEDIIKESGADILRLWVAMSDYTQEVHLSREILARAVEAYRKFRNTLRYLLANLYDFNPAVDVLEPSRLEEIDRYILTRYAVLGQRMLDAYEAYDYATIFQSLNGFTTVDLSAVYNDISKDRLYTFAARSHERRSAQTAMYVLADGLTRLVAPILPVTAEELWRVLPGTRGKSVHLETFPTPVELTRLVDHDLFQRWAKLMAIREQVVAEIEPLRKGKQIGSSLQAKVVLSGPARELDLLQRYVRDLPMLFIVSEVELRAVPALDTAGSGGGVRVGIERTDGVKCERCWRYVPSVSNAPERRGVCDRCLDALAERVSS